MYQVSNLDDLARASLKQSHEYATRSGDFGLICKNGYLLGFNYYIQRNIDSAVYFLEASIKANQRMPAALFDIELHYLLARSFLRGKRYNEGIKKLQYVITNIPRVGVKWQNSYHAGAYMYLADAYALQNKIDSAYYYFEFCKELSIYENPELYENAHFYLASSFFAIGNYNEAAKLFDILLANYGRIPIPETAAQTYLKINEFEKAAPLFDLALSEKDSAHKQELEDLNIVLQESAKSGLEKQRMITQQREIAAQDVNNAQKRQRNLILMSGAIILVLLLFFGRFIYKRYQVIKVQKEEINQQKMAVEMKSREVLDSIIYAKRIQDAILPSISYINSCLADNFIIYKPKAVVAGDFYWFDRIGNTILFAAADCTGHGVPGAMVSVVCHNALNRCVHEFGLMQPNLILDKARSLIIETFQRSGEQVKDGMDIALCALNVRVNELEFSGANNGLYVVRNGKLSELKGDRQPVGKFEKVQPFSLHKMKLERGDILYLSTDGFADQFGGVKGKKYKYLAFKSFLSNLYKENLSTQAEKIDHEFEKWRGSLEQVDDVCVIGVRI